MKKKNILALLALLFITEYLPAMELDSDSENTAEKYQKRKTVGPLDKRGLKKVKLQAFLEEEEETSTQQIIFTEEPNYIEVHLNWDGLPEEIQLFILSFLINTQNVITPQNAEQFSAQFKQYALLKLVNKKMNDLASDKQLFDLPLVIAHLIQTPVQNNRPGYLPKILGNAAKYDCVNIIKLALEKGLPIEKNFYLLIDASKFRHIELCKKLILWGIIEGAKNTALIQAICLYDLDRVKTLIALKKTIALLNDRSTELMISAGTDNIDILRLLLNANPQNINAKAHDGRTALYSAASKGHTEIAQLLLNNNAGIEAKTSSGKTALHVAALNGHTEIVQLLLNNNADIKAKEVSDGTALHFAAALGHIEVVRLLLNNGADITAKAVYGGTALHCAVVLGHIEIVQLLLNSGADITAKAVNGETALDIATIHGHIDIVQFLNEKMNLTNQTNLTD